MLCPVPWHPSLLHYHPYLAFLQGSQTLMPAGPRVGLNEFSEGKIASGGIVAENLFQIQTFENIVLAK